MNRCDVEYRQSSNKRLLVELTLIEVAQITQPDDDVPAAGRSPRRLKSLFKFLVSTTQSKPAQQVAGTEKSLSLRAAQRQHTEETVADTPKVTVTTNTVAGPSPSGQRQQTVSGTMAGGGNATKPKFNFGTLGMSFDNLLKENSKKPEYIQDFEPTNKDEKEKFTQTDLEREWLSMCQRMKATKPGEAERLANIKPTITEYPNIEIVVDNEILKKEIAPIQGRLRKTMAVYLHNGNIQFSIRVARQEEIKPILSPAQTFEKMRKDNPAVDSLVRQLGLELV